MSVIWKGFSAFQIVQLVLYLWHGGSIMPGPFGEICTGCLSQSELSLKLHSLSSSLFINWHHNTFPTCFLRSRSQISLYGLERIPFSWKFRKINKKEGNKISVLRVRKSGMIFPLEFGLVLQSTLSRKNWKLIYFPSDLIQVILRANQLILSFIKILFWRALYNNLLVLLLFLENYV